MELEIVENTLAVKEMVADMVKRGDCILFLGAGVHAPPPEDSPYIYPEEYRPLLGQDLAQKLDEECHYKEKFPNERCRQLQMLWQDLAQMLDKGCKYKNKFPNERCLELQRVSLCYAEDFGRNKLVGTLNRYLRDGKKPSPALMMLAGLPFKIFITTNYDHHLESALSKHDKDTVTFVYDPDTNKPTPDMFEDPTSERPLLFKMHGDLKQPDSIVITDEDYITFVQRMSDKPANYPVPETVRFRMKKWPILFIGYSLRDYNLRLIFRTLRWRLDEANFPRAYSIVKNPDLLILKVWQYERNFITFVAQDLWTFVPWLYKKVKGEEYKDA